MTDREIHEIAEFTAESCKVPYGRALTVVMNSALKVKAMEVSDLKQKIENAKKIVSAINRQIDRNFLELKGFVNEIDSLLKDRDLELESTVEVNEDSDSEEEEVSEEEVDAEALREHDRSQEALSKAGEKGKDCRENPFRKNTQVWYFFEVMKKNPSKIWTARELHEGALELGYHNGCHEPTATPHVLIPRAIENIKEKYIKRIEDGRNIYFQLA